MNKLYFPLTIESTRKSIKLTNSSSLLRIDSRKAQELIGIRDILLSDSGHVREICYRENAPWIYWSMYLQNSDITHNIRIMQTNFLLETDNRDEATIIAFAIKLLGRALSGPYVGFSGSTPQQLHVSHLHYSPYWGDKFLTLDNKQILLLRNLLHALTTSPQDERLKTIIEKYRYAESNNVPSLNLRFLEFAIILEMLFLPKANQELSYRFQLRLAKWFHKHYKEDTITIAEKAKKIYRNRSHIAHSGRSKISNEDINNISDITRRALRKYVLEKSIFTDDYLENLCLLG